MDRCWHTTPHSPRRKFKAIVVKDKWVASVQLTIEGEVQRVIQALATRVQELEERYAQPLPELASEVDEFSAKVDEHLRKMGVDWV